MAKLVGNFVHKVSNGLDIWHIVSQAFSSLAAFFLFTVFHFHSDQSLFDYPIVSVRMVSMSLGTHACCFLFLS